MKGGHCRLAAPGMVDMRTRHVFLQHAGEQGGLGLVILDQKDTRLA